MAKRNSFFFALITRYVCRGSEKSQWTTRYMWSGSEKSQWTMRYVWSSSEKPQWTMRYVWSGSEKPPDVPGNAASMDADSPSPSLSSKTFFLCPHLTRIFLPFFT